MEIQLIKISEEERQLLSTFYGEDLGNEIDFNRLMPVVEKIEAIDNDDLIIEIRFRLCHIEYDEFGIRNFVGETKIQSVYKAVVEFIKWYNTQSK